MGMLDHIAIPQLENLHQNIIFQLDGDPTHWRDCLDERFPN